MIGVASGLVNAGFIPICYAITNFLIERCFEQIRNDICLHNYKVLLVGTSTGYDNGALGATHHKLHDIGAVKVLPGLRIYSPSGTDSISQVLDDALESENPSFIRISKLGIENEGPIDGPNHFIRHVRENTLIISHGRMIANALAAFNILPKFSIYAMDRIKPLDNYALSKLFSDFQNIIVLEDNFKSGLFNSICQWYVENDINNTRLISIAPNEVYDGVVGDANYFEEKYDLTAQAIVERVIEIAEN